MNWIFASVVTMLLWGGYGIFAEKATAIHGEKVSFVFELAGMIVVALSGIALALVNWEIIVAPPRV